MTMGTRRTGYSRAVGLVVMMAAALLMPLRAPAQVADVHLQRLPPPPRAAGMARVSKGIAPTVAYAWGVNQSGQLGTGSLSYSNVPLAVSRIGGVVALAGGGGFSLALRRDGTVWAWGTNELGELGAVRATCATRYERFPCSDVPVQIRGLSGVVSVSAGAGHALALTGDGAVWAWGAGEYGALGDGHIDDSFHATPSRVPGLAHVRAIAAGGWSSLAVAGDGTVWAWGANRPNQEDGTNMNSYPVRVPGLRDVVAVAGDFEYGLALRRDGTVWAWGTNAAGEQGNGHVDDSFHATPSRVLRLKDIVAVACGGGAGYALARDGAVWTWGSRQTSVGAVQPLPTRVRGLPPVTAMAAGAAFDLALARDGHVWAWGANNDGELGNGRSGGRSSTPVLVRRLTHVVAIAAGAWHGLALRAGVSKRTGRATVNMRPAPARARWAR